MLKFDESTSLMPVGPPKFLQWNAVKDKKAPRTELIQKQVLPA